MAPNATLSTDDSDPEKCDIKEPHENDVLCGRGGSINSWKGNERFRTLVEKRKRVYLTARFKREKRLIACSIVQDIQSLNPPGRFLSRNAKTGTWYVIDDDKARDKVSQALRENAPTVRAEIETEINEQRAEIQRTEQHPQHSAPPPNAPLPNPYYPQQEPQQPQGWGYFSYYGYAQQTPPHTPGAPPPPPMPPQYHTQQQPGYGHDGQWNMPQQQQHTPAPTPPPSSQPQPSTFDFSFSSKPSQDQQQQPQQHQPDESQQQDQQQPQYDESQQDQQQQQGQQQNQDDEKSIFDVMSAVFPSSLASWTKDAFSISGGLSVTSMSRDDQHETASVASKPIKYIHQPEDNQSVSSRARSVTFKDERSISGRSLDNRKHNRPPRIMHSSQINYPRRPKIGANGILSGPNASGRLPPTNPNQNATSNYMAPVSSVHLTDANDGTTSMISLITTEGMNSIMEEGSDMMSFRQRDPIDDQGTYHPSMPPPGMPDHRRIKARPQRRLSGLSNAPDDASNSMLTAVANQIVMGLGSWDASTIGCGPDGPAALAGMPNEAQNYLDTMAVEIEGQEVQLVDMMDANSGSDTPTCNNSVIEDRMPAHDREPLQMDWPSRVGSCHSFFNDSLAGASFFSSTNSRGEPLSPASSMDMDVSSGTDPYSCAGSVGGASLCRVFDAEGNAQNQMGYSFPSPSMHNQMLRQMPSWERNLRNKSPLSVGSSDGAEEDHYSFTTKSSEKLAGGSISTVASGENSSNQNGNNDKAGAMAWENHRKE